MIPAKPRKTLIDYMVVSISPALIILMVGSLCFFLVEVFYRGEAVGSVRWVLFWFVIAVVLVSRIGIEQGVGYATGYGLALAAATWLYLSHIHPAYLLGALTLGIVWWFAHKLTWDCTLIDDADDSSGSGLLQMVWKRKPVIKLETSIQLPKLETDKAFRKSKSAAVHPPGVWLIYFSLAALPLFGIGQTLLPAGDVRAHRICFEYLFIYLSAALGLLLTTSFLGLRRYLRQRYLPMPGSIAVGWLKFGAGAALIVLSLALLLPRPGVSHTWGTLRYHIDYQLRRASEYAMRFNPHGTGSGQVGNHEQEPSGPQNSNRQNGKTQSNSANKSSNQSGGNQNGAARNQGSPPANSRPVLSEAAGHFYQWLKLLLLLAGTIIVCWWLFRQRNLIFQIIQSFLAALVQFFRDLFSFGSKLTSPALGNQKSTVKRQPFSSYKNPFVTGSDRFWTPEELILHSYDALQCWASEQGIKPSPKQTAREFCGGLGEQFSEVIPELNHLAFLYGHVAYGTSIPRNYNVELLKQLWRYISIPRRSGGPPALETAANT
ncbi:MAG: hypothetical protein ACREFE_00040 [Limisphaerales bacterium]